MSKHEGGNGFFANLQSLTISLMAMLHTRMELLGNEVEVEKLRILRMLLLAQALMFSACVAALLVVALLTLWLWEQRLGVLGLFACIFLACAVLAYRALMQMANRPESSFAATFDELREDLRRLKAASGDATTPD